jgi:hypothetical protein
MKPCKLSQYFSVKRRYTRSINLERDFDRVEMLEGYIITERSQDVLQRILTSLGNPDANRAWILTSVYGTGKSSFAHFLGSLIAGKNTDLRRVALEIAGAEFSERIGSNIPKTGLIRAIATAKREPIANTILRALVRGINEFWQGKKKSKAAKEILELQEGIESGNPPDRLNLTKLIKDLQKSAKTGIFIIIDELGKNLEYAAYNEGAEDLYLLQQLAESSYNSESPIYLLFLLHQAFSEYGQRLATVRRNEWIKINNRFEDISFADSPSQTVRLISQAICRDVKFNISTANDEWFEILAEIREDLTREELAAIYPLHPLAVLALPLLCRYYGQNDRSLFTFLTSNEPYSFANFLQEVEINHEIIPTLKIDRIYDYFIEAVGLGIGSRPHQSRWVEIYGLIADARHLEEDSLRVLKTIGAFNLLGTTNAIKATRKLVTLALCDSPHSEKKEHWDKIIDRLLKRGMITHYKTLDELRIWQGSDFNVDAEVESILEKERSLLSALLDRFYPLSPLVIQRHSYITGTLRYFERRYWESSQDVRDLSCHVDCDGLILYWLDEELPQDVPKFTIDGKPLILLCGLNLGTLRIHALEFSALQQIKNNASQLQTDGVARREVNYRLGQAQKLLSESIKRTFGLMRSQVCWIAGEQKKINSVRGLQTQLSMVCDRIYSQTPRLWNELINRRELTSQGSMARRQLLEAMLKHPDRERLELKGYGPEVSMYSSVLLETGIHRQLRGEWGFYKPAEASGVLQIWQTIEKFCVSATEKPQTLDLLDRHLMATPYGMKRGAISIFLAAVLSHYTDDVAVYKEGTFIPVLEVEHFELLVKYPAWFAVKYFAVTGLRSQVFKELESVLSQPRKYPKGSRNTTLLNVVTPLLQFARQLPEYTQKTQKVSLRSQKILRALQETREPDDLLFNSLPVACDLPPIGMGEADNGTTAKTLRKYLGQSFRELQGAYDESLKTCRGLLYEAFRLRQDEDNLRDDLYFRSSKLMGKILQPLLNRFVGAAMDKKAGDREWLEAILMVVGDKPPQSWNDGDMAAFEVKLGDLARQFKNLEALQANVEARGDSHGFEARRITVTRPDGEETNQIVWIASESEAKLENLVEEVLQTPLLKDNWQLQQSFVAKLTERVLSSRTAENVVRMEERKKNEQEDESDRRSGTK